MNQELRIANGYTGVKVLVTVNHRVLKLEIYGDDQPDQYNLDRDTNPFGTKHRIFLLYLMVIVYINYVSLVSQQSDRPSIVLAALPAKAGLWPFNCNLMYANMPDCAGCRNLTPHQ
jgi:hypothetical protein